MRDTWKSIKLTETEIFCSSIEIYKDSYKNDKKKEEGGTLESKILSII